MLWKSGQCEPNCYMRTDTHMTTVIVSFSNCANAPSNWALMSSCTLPNGVAWNSFLAGWITHVWDGRAEDALWSHDKQGNDPMKSPCEVSTADSLSRCVDSKRVWADASGWHAQGHLQVCPSTAEVVQVRNVTVYSPVTRPWSLGVVCFGQDQKGAPNSGETSSFRASLPFCIYRLCWRLFIVITILFKSS